MSTNVDLFVHGGGSVYLLRPTSRRGSAWVAEHIAPDATVFGGAIVVEHRYVRAIRASNTLNDGGACNGVTGEGFRNLTRGG